MGGIDALSTVILFLRQPLVLLWTFSGCVNHHQQDVIGYLVEENRVLKEQMKGRRLRLTDEQRRRLAAKGKLLGPMSLTSLP